MAHGEARVYDGEQAAHEAGSRRTVGGKLTTSERHNESAGQAYGLTAASSTTWPTAASTQSLKSPTAEERGSHDVVKVRKRASRSTKPTAQGLDGSKSLAGRNGSTASAQHNATDDEYAAARQGRQQQALDKARKRRHTSILTKLTLASMW